MSRSSTNCLARATSAPGLVEHHRRAVEDELVLAADEVHVDDRHRRVGGPGGEHRLALAQPARVVRRRVDVDDQLGAAGGLRDDRPGRAPRVLADRDADPDAADHEQRAVDGRRREVPLLVEHRVVREQVLAVDALHLAVRADRGGVVEVAAGLGEADHRGEPPGARRDLLERLGGLGDERRLQQEVLGRVAGDRELGERDEVAARGVGLARRRRGSAPTLPARSPTTRSSWAAARRNRGISPGYGLSVAARHCTA